MKEEDLEKEIESISNYIERTFEVAANFSIAILRTVDQVHQDRTNIFFQSIIEEVRSYKCDLEDQLEIGVHGAEFIDSILVKIFKFLAELSLEEISSNINSNQNNHALLTKYFGDLDMMSDLNDFNNIDEEFFKEKIITRKKDLIQFYLKNNSLKEPEKKEQLDTDSIPIFYANGLNLFKLYTGKFEVLLLTDLSFIIHQLILDKKIAPFPQKVILEYLFNCNLITKELYDDFSLESQLVSHKKSSSKLRIERYKSD